MICPNCGAEADFREHEERCVETHGLDCGPYETWTERWLTCSKCGAKTDDNEIRSANSYPAPFDVLEKVEYPGMRFLIGRAGAASYLQVKFDTTDTATGEEAVHKGRKWLLSVHMTETEIVQTALKAILTIVEHEARERFLYCGEAVYDPHCKIEDLLHFRRTSVRDSRKESK